MKNPIRPITTVTLMALTLPLSFIPPVQGQESRTFLWSIETQTNTVYLLGSVHLLSIHDYPLPQAIQSAFEAAETLVFEVDINDLNDPEATATVLQSALPDHPEERLPIALNPENYALAEAEASLAGLPIAAFDNFEPWFFSITLTTAKLLQLGFSPEYGLDTYLFERAIEADKKTQALETVAEQMDLFDDLSVETQQAMVQQTLAELSILETSFEEMKEAWRIGDVETFEHYISEGLAPYPEVQATLFTQRNQAWLEKIVPLLNQNEDYLVVVGAGHLVGEDGLIELLQANGYDVQQQ